MQAVWYETQGPAAEVLHHGELPDPDPGPGEVRVRLAYSAISPGDTKKRRTGFSDMAFARVIPHSDGAGVIDAVGEGADAGRIGQRVWVYGAQSYRPFGTAAQFSTVPDAQAVALPDGVEDRLGACFGIPGITAHRAVFADGPVAGKIILIQGVLGAVSSLAAQLARWRGATVIGTVRRAADLYGAAEVPADHVVALDVADPAAAIREHAPGGVDRIVEVAFSENADLDAAVGKLDTVIAAYATRRDRPDFPFWPMLFNNTIIRLLGSDDFPAAAKTEAAQDLTRAAGAGALQVPIGVPLALERAAEAHDRVDAGSRERVLLAIPD